jgi:YHS domain-containing protein
VRHYWGFLFLFSSLNAVASHEFNTNKNGVILEGYDVVSYFQSTTPKKGNSNFQTKIENVTYWFSSEENKNIFLKDPKKYEPAFGGWCAYAVADSKSKVEVDPKSFVIQNGRLLVFYDGLFGDTRKKWTTTKNKDANAYLKEADSNWPELKPKVP